jgi:hypothetical protein
MNIMKKFSKRVNRGLLLGGIVLAGFIAFVITDTISFKKNKPVIEDEIKSYVSSLEDLGVTQNMDKSSFTSEISDLINNYWTFTDEKTSSFYYGLNQNEFRNNLEIMANDAKSNAYVSKWTAKIGKVSISKAGPGYATATFDCQLVAEFAGNAYLLTPSNAMTTDSYAYYGEASPTGLSRISIDAQYQATMTKKDGKWKICLVQDCGWNSSEITPISSEEGGNEE